MSTSKKGTMVEAMKNAGMKPGLLHAGGFATSKPTLIGLDLAYGAVTPWPVKPVYPVHPVQQAVATYLDAQTKMITELDKSVQALAGTPGHPTVSPDDLLKLEGYKGALQDLKAHLLSKNLIPETADPPTSKPKTPKAPRKPNKASKEGQNAIKTLEALQDLIEKHASKLAEDLHTHQCAEDQGLSPLDIYKKYKLPSKGWLKAKKHLLIQINDVIQDGKLAK